MSADSWYSIDDTSMTMLAPISRTFGRQRCVLCLRRQEFASSTSRQSDVEGPPHPSQPSNDGEAGPSKPQLSTAKPSIDKISESQAEMKRIIEAGLAILAPTQSPQRGTPNDSPEGAAKSTGTRDKLFADPSSSPPPVRPLRGVHASRLRSQGHTPAERESIQQVLRSIFDDLQNNGTFTPYASLSGDPYGSSRSNDRLGLGSTSSRFGFENLDLGRGPKSRFTDRDQRYRRLMERDVSEEDEALTLELDALREELAMVSTDVELVNWAAEKVFKPLPSSDPIDGAAPASTLGAKAPASQPLYTPPTTSSSSTSYDPTTQIFSRSYPQILGQLMKTARHNFNNPPLALAFFHRAQTQSLDSYLAGCLAPAYNELIRVRWDSYRDLEGVDQAVREMEVNGVAWNRATSELVNGIAESVSRDLLTPQGAQRWGPKAAERVARLEKRVEKDVRNEESLFAYKKMAKAHWRTQDTASFRTGAMAMRA